MRDDGCILGGQFSVVQQAIGTARGNEAAARFLRDLVEEAKASGLVARLSARTGAAPEEGVYSTLYEAAIEQLVAYSNGAPINVVEAPSAG